ncbi:MAG: hypothetical protein R6X02_34800 [Enhygromyxa sp.]
MSLSERWIQGWRAPYSLTAMLPTAGASTEVLRRQLGEREPAILQALAGVTGLHALRIVVIDDDQHPPRLLVNSVSDEGSAEHRRGIAAALAPFVGDLVDARPTTPATLEGALREHGIRERTVFLASPGVSLAQIRKEARLREVLRAWIREARASGALDRMSLEEARLAARAHVEERGDPTCASGPTPSTEGTWRRALDFVLTFLAFPPLGVLGKDVWLAARALPSPARRTLATFGLALWWIWAAPFTALAFLTVRFAEASEPDQDPEPASDAKLRRIETVEDGRSKNELTVWFPVRPSVLGRALMRLVLFGAERGTRHLWTKGSLAGAQNIHFARLLLVDRGRRMVFMSDYQGSFDGYVDHFVGVGGHTRAVVPISSRVHGCPKTRWLYWPVDPVSFRTRWRAMARSYQRQASVRYIAYPDLSANDILRHREIRDGLFADRLAPEQLQTWARKI